MSTLSHSLIIETKQVLVTLVNRKGYCLYPKADLSQHVCNLVSPISFVLIHTHTHTHIASSVTFAYNFHARLFVFEFINRLVLCVCFYDSSVGEGYRERKEGRETIESINCDVDRDDDKGRGETCSDGQRGTV